MANTTCPFFPGKCTPPSSAGYRNVMTLKSVLHDIFWGNARMYLGLVTSWAIVALLVAKLWSGEPILSGVPDKDELTPVVGTLTDLTCEPRARSHDLLTLGIDGTNYQVVIDGRLQTCDTFREVMLGQHFGGEVAILAKDGVAFDLTYRGERLIERDRINSREIDAELMLYLFGIIGAPLTTWWFYRRNNSRREFNDQPQQ